MRRQPRTHGHPPGSARPARVWRATDRYGAKVEQREDARRCDRRIRRASVAKGGGRRRPGPDPRRYQGVVHPPGIRSHEAQRHGVARGIAAPGRERAQDLRPPAPPLAEVQRRNIVDALRGGGERVAPAGQGRGTAAALG